MHTKCLKAGIWALTPGPMQQVWRNFAYMPESAIRGQYSGLAEYTRHVGNTDDFFDGKIFHKRKLWVAYKGLLC